MTGLDAREPLLDDVSEEDFLWMRGVYLSRLMLNMFVGWAPETRSFEEFVRDQKIDGSPKDATEGANR